MKKQIFLLSIFAFGVFCQAQVSVSENPTSSPEEKPLDYSEKQPEFPGGQGEMMKFIGRSIKYPKLARENNVQGRVIATFVVGKDGSIQDVRVIKDIGSGCGEETIRVIKSMPKWIPGEQKGKPVSVRYTLPVMFRLDDDFDENAKPLAPEFRGGEAAMQKHLSANLRYPKNARKQKIEGTVLVRATINEKGKVRGVEIAPENQGHELLQKEALRVVKSMPPWKPGSEKGIVREMQVLIPVVFKL